MLREKLGYIPHANPSFGDNWKWDFIIQIPKSIRRKELIKYTDLLDWDKIGKKTIAEIKIVMKKIDIPEINPTLKFNRALVEGIILTDIKNRLHFNILYHLTNITKRDSKAAKKSKIKNLMDILLFEIKRCRSLYEMMLQFGSLRWIDDSNSQKEIFNKVQEDLSKFHGQPFHNDNLLLYSETLIENDKYKKKYGRDNYRGSAFTVTKYNDTKLDNLRKALDNFMLSTGIRTYKQFKKSSYYNIVEEYKKSINHSRLEKKSPPA